MAGVPRREPIDERVARHLREERVANLALGLGDGIGCVVEADVVVDGPTLVEFAPTGLKASSDDFAIVDGDLAFSVSGFYVVTVSARWDEDSGGWRSIAAVVPTTSGGEQIAADRSAAVTGADTVTNAPGIGVVNAGETLQVTVEHGGAAGAELAADVVLGVGFLGDFSVARGDAS